MTIRKLPGRPPRPARRPALAAAALAVTVVLAGCNAPSPKPAPSSRPGSRSGSASDATAGSDPVRVAGDIARLVAERTGRKEPVNVLVVGNIAVVGLGEPAASDRDAVPPRTPGRTPPPGAVTPPGLAPRPGAQGGTAPPAASPPGPALGTYTPPPGSTGVLDGAVAERVRSRHPFLKRVYSTNDRVVVTRIASLARDLRNGTPVDRRIDEVAWVVRAVSAPAAPTPAAPGTRS